MPRWLTIIKTKGRKKESKTPHNSFKRKKWLLYCPTSIDGHKNIKSKGILMAKEKSKNNKTKEEPIEKEFWESADKLRKNIDAAEY